MRYNIEMSRDITLLCQSFCLHCCFANLSEVNEFMFCFFLEGAKVAAGGESSQPKSLKGKKDAVSEKKGAHHERKGSDKSSEKEKKKEVPAPRLQFDDMEKVAKAKRRSIVEQTETKNRVELFRHLPQFVYGTQLPSLEAKFFQDDATHPHPAVYQVWAPVITQACPRPLI